MQRSGAFIVRFDDEKRAGAAQQTRHRPILRKHLAYHESLYRSRAEYRRRVARRSEEHTSELQLHRDLHSFPTRRSSDLWRSTANKTSTNTSKTSGIP